MKPFPKGFEIEQCIPTEDDFKTVLEAKKTGNTWRLLNKAEEDEVKAVGVDNYRCYHYPHIRYAVVATLFGWKGLQELATRRIFNSSGENYDPENFREILNIITSAAYIHR